MSVKTILILFPLLLVITTPTSWAQDAGGLEALREAAEQGNADAQMEMGTLYEFGYNRPKDMVTTLAWYMLAGAQGYVLAANAAHSWKAA